MRPAAAAAAFVLVLAAGDAMCSQVAFQPLHDVVREQTFVFRAKVVAVENRDDADTLRTRYTLEGIRALRGKPGAVTTAVYEEIVPVMRDEKGNITGWFSPILPASGAERQVKKGTEYFFFANVAAQDGEVRVFRVEPLSKEKEIRKVIEKLPKEAP